jgi:two-component system, chemotaxis family, protein-glutamate methylesterase/glutaminase
MEDFASALPLPLDARPQRTALSCPDCSGTLTVQIEGSSGYLHFRCRIGHSFSLLSLLACKEEVLETRLWESVTALEELVSLLHDLDRAGSPYRNGCPHDEGRRRVETLQGAAAVLRGLLDANVPLPLRTADAADGAC